LPDNATKLLISGGPHRYQDVPNVNLVDFGGPILGICLGCLCLVNEFGGKVLDSDGPIATTWITTDPDEIFNGETKQIEVTIAHRQKIIEVPKSMKVIATAGSEIMAVRHRTSMIWGVLFHPESPACPGARCVITNFFNL